MTSKSLTGGSIDKKQCNRCGIIKPLTEFHKSKRHSYGRTNYCKDCRTQYMKLYFSIDRTNKPAPIITPERQCVDCLKILPPEVLVKHTGTKAGYRKLCLDCSKLREKVRYRKYPLVMRDKVRAYSKTARGRKVHNESSKRTQKKFPYKYRARVALRYAVKLGKIMKPKQCSRCCAGGRIEGHHEDYSKPLDVKWLCGPCHVSAHGRSIYV